VDTAVNLTEPLAPPMDPEAALARVAYLLDRTLAPSQKALAFGKALETVRSLGPDTIAAKAADGTLGDLPGIGKSTGSVIAEALAGKVPDYLRKLEDSGDVPLSDAAKPYRAALKGDCHLHSEWSDGGAPIEVMARTAQALGHEYMVLTDHSPRLTVAHGLNRDRLIDQIGVIERLNDELAPFRILTGMEVDILEDGALDMDEDLLDRLDIVVASVHSKLKMPADEMTRRMVLAIASPHTDILGHLTGRKVSSTQVARVLAGEDQAGPGAPIEDPERDTSPKRAQSSFDADLVFAACAKFDKAVEINSRPERQDPPDDLLDLALEWGCKIAIDTDAHAPGQLEWQAFGCEKAARHEIDLDRIVNTWDADTLLEWSRSHAAGPSA
jgi:putative hydrolase